MVQKKVLNKLGIKTDHIKANKQIMNHKPSLPMSQSHDIKNRGAEFIKKKMMKKSGKTKHSEYEICRSPKLRKYVPQPGKPPPSTNSSTPNQHQQQQQQQQESAYSPNYMKSTSSSVARKEQSQVSSRTPQTYSQSCSSRKNSNNSKLGSASSVNKPTRSLLARTPSFKPTRVLVSSCSPIVLYDNFQVERATCSSTLKESKFPSYLELSPGGTESDGTSVFKVCPYTYCSLNGHHHPPLPPLKCFRSARRRTLKNQKNFKLACLSPGRANLRGLGSNDSVPKQIESTTEKVAPLINEDDKEFFVEIYSKEKEETNSVDDIVQGEVDYESLSMHNELEMEGTTQELESEASDMDWEVEKYFACSEDETSSISNDIDPITLVDDSVINKEFTEKASNPELLSENILEESFDKESIISGTSYDYDDSESICSHTELGIDECVEAPEETSFISLDVNFILDGIDSETTTTDYQAVVKAEETFCPEDEISTSYADDATALTGYQELNVYYLNEVQDETCKDDENIVVKMEDTETKTDCCEQGNENGQQVVVESDLKDESDEDCTSHQAGDGTEYAPGVEEDQTAEACVEKQNQIKYKKTHAKYDSSDEASERYINLRGIARRSDTKEPEESREFNPRPPNFLPLEPDPDAEKVDLKHQMMDDRKNAEDWMLDFALRRAVDKLAPARKRKVALLVEAFETVLPTSKWEPHLRRRASGFAHPRPIQACN